MIALQSNVLAVKLGLIGGVGISNFSLREYLIRDGMDSMELSIS